MNAADERVRRWDSLSLPEDKLAEVFLEYEWVHLWQNKDWEHAVSLVITDIALLKSRLHGETCLIIWFWANIVWPFGFPRDARSLHVGVQHCRAQFRKWYRYKLWFVVILATMNNANQSPNGEQSVMPVRLLSIAREGHRMLLRGTSWIGAQEKAATTEDLA